MYVNLDVNSNTLNHRMNFISTNSLGLYEDKHVIIDS